MSGLAAVDLDSAEDYDLIYLLSELKKIPSIAYAGASCRGKRLFCIVPFQFPNEYKRQYERLIQSFKDYGLPMGDECHKSISQPRFVSWNNDETQFFNHKAIPYALISPGKSIFPVMHSNKYSSNYCKDTHDFKWCNEQIDKTNSFIKGQRHSYIIQLARYCNMKGLPIGETLAGCLSYTQLDFGITEIQGIVDHIYKTQIDSHSLYA